MRFFSLSFLLVTLFSCTAVKVSVPEAFARQSDKMHVSGLNGWMINQQLSFGQYTTSKVKRGWDFSSAFQHTKWRMSPEEMILKAFQVDTDKKNLNQRNKYQYTIYDGRQEAAVFATEKFEEKQLVYKSNNPRIGNLSQTNNYQYAFTATVLPAVDGHDEPWSVVMINKYDREKDAGRKIFERPVVEEEGYATNGKETIAIRSLFLDKVKQNNGKETKVFGGRILSGYELKWDDGVVAVVDILDNNIWLARDLEPTDKLILSSISSAILLKRMQDVEKDRDALDDL